MRDFLDWWIQELVRLASLLRSVRECPELSGKLGRDAVGTETGMKALHTFQEPLCSLSDQGVILDEQLRLPSATHQLPLSRSLALASALLAEKTPFGISDVHVVPSSSIGAGCHFYIIKKTALDPALTQLQAPETKIRRLGIRDGDKIHWIPSRVLETLHPVFHHIRHWRNGLLAASAILLVACGATYAHAFLRYSAAEKELADLIESKRSEALQVRKLLDRQQKSVAAVEAARKGKVQAVPVVRVWEELTRVLPDDAWLTDVAVDGDTMTITGFAAQSAASLIATLDASGLFSEPSFISPVVRIPGQSGERFEIRLRIEAA